MEVTTSLEGQKVKGKRGFGSALSLYVLGHGYGMGQGNMKHGYGDVVVMEKQGGEWNCCGRANKGRGR